MTNNSPPHKLKKPISNKKTRPKNLFIVDHARLDPSHCLADNLFRPLFRGSRTSSKLDVHYSAKNSDLTSFWFGPEILDIGDQSIFLAIHRLAAQIGRPQRVDQNHSIPAFVTVRNALNMTHSAETLECLVLTTTPNEIAAIIDIKLSGQAKIRILESLNRLSEVSHSIYKNSDPKTILYQSKILSVLTENGQTTIGISPVLSRAIVAAPSSFIDMREQRALKSGITKRLHLWLSSWIGANNIEAERTINLDLLIPHVWGNTGVEDALYYRRTALKTAINELTRLTGWTCTVDTTAANKCEVHINRQAIKIGQAIVVESSDVTDESTGRNAQTI